MIDDRYRDRFEAEAIPLDFAESLGVHSIETDDELPPEFSSWAGEGATPGLLFPHPSVTTGEVTWQLKPDSPVTARDGSKRKYLWPKGSPLVFTLHGEHRKRIESPSATVLLVEGTKQTIAAARWAPDGVAVVGIGGIYGHRDRELGLLADIRGFRLDKRPVVLSPDADAGAKLPVWQGLKDLFGTFRMLTSGDVRIADLGAIGGSRGLDDHLGMIDEEERPHAIGTLIQRSERRMPKKPPAANVYERPGSAAFLTASFAGALVQEYGDDAGVDEVSGRLLVKHAGVWLPATEIPRVQEFLLDGAGEGWTAKRTETVLDLASNRLKLEGRIVPDRTPEPVVTFANGIVRLDEEPYLRPFESQPATRIRFPVEWDDDAECPVYDEWIAEQTAGPDDPQLVAELLGQVFDTFRYPDRHALLYGPSRSGKSTLQRLIQAAVPRERRSAVSLHDLADNQFAASHLDGVVLNSVADLSSASVRDLSKFKQVTGGDEVWVEGKNMKGWHIRPAAVHLFSANAIPAIGEDSLAYLNRVTPVSFPTTFAGRENPRIEAAMMAELPGIVLGWVSAHAARIARGGVWTKSFGPVAAEFQQASNPVAEFIAEETKPGVWTARRKVYVGYRDWMLEGGGRPVRDARFYASCRSLGVKERKLHGVWQFDVGIRS